MKRSTKLTRILALLLAVLMIFTACSKKEEKETTADTPDTTQEDKADDTAKDADAEEPAPVEMEETTINIRVMNEFINLDKIVAEYENRVKDDPILSKIHLNFEYVPGADYKDKLSMAVSAQEDYDLMFCGAWHGLSNYIAQGSFKDLSSYFNNDKFPGLKAAFPENFLNPVKSYVKNDSGAWETKLYSIPLAEVLYDIRGLAYREDLRVKYNIPEITNDEILMQYVKAIKENEPDMIPMQMYNGFFYWETSYFKGAQKNVYWQEIIGQETPFYVAVSDDGKTVIDAAVMGDDASQFANYPDGFNYDFIKEYELNHLKWADYLDPVRGTTEEAVGTPAIVYTTLNGMVNEINNLKTNETIMAEYPDASIRFYPTEESQRNMEPGAIVSEMKSNNFLVVPEWSEKTDAVMYFLDWLWSSQENHDLFQFGIEGTHWEATSDNTYKLLPVEEADKYQMPGYSFCWNPTFVRYNNIYTETPELNNWIQYALSDEAYTVSDISGFAFNPVPVETEIANVSALSNELLLRHALHGTDTEAVIAQWNSDAKAVGLDTIREELKKQLQEFLDMKNSIK